MVNYKLFYFNGRGLAEPIRLIFAHAKVPFEDIRVPREEWPKLKESMEWGQLPVLEVDGVQLSQTRAIVRFLGRRYGLTGSNDLEAAKCDEYMDAIEDLRQACSSNKIFWEEDPAKKAEMRKKAATDSEKYLVKFESILEKNKSSGWLAGNKMTFADICLAHRTHQMNTHLPDLIDFGKFPQVTKHEENVSSQPGIKEWIASRPKTDF